MARSSRIAALGGYGSRVEWVGRPLFLNGGRKVRECG